MGMGPGMGMEGEMGFMRVIRSEDGVGMEGGMGSGRAPVTGPSGAMEAGLADSAPRAGQAALLGLDGVATGPLSLDLDLTPVGTPYHFRKLHGDPRIVLSARHERFNAVGCPPLSGPYSVWAWQRPSSMPCGRSDLAPWLNRGWPWLAAIAGIAWLFLLPAGAVGLIVFFIALCVLIGRASKKAAPTAQNGPQRWRQEVGLVRP